MTLLSPSTAIRAVAPAVAVSVRAHWADAWTTTYGLYADQVRFAVSPAVSAASLSYRYGRGCDPGGDGRRGVRGRLDIAGWYVRIAAAPVLDEAGVDTGEGAPPWYGRITSEEDERYGALPALDGGPRLAAGVQRFGCLGLEADLDTRIDRAYCESPGGAMAVIGRAIAFNGGSSSPRDRRRGLVPNRSQSRGAAAGAHYLFAAALGSTDLGTKPAAVWTAGDIVGYLLARFAPADRDGLGAIPWGFDDEPVRDFLAAYTPVLDPSGETLKTILDALFDRRRGLGWRVEVRAGGAAGERPTICPFAFADEAIELDSGEVLPANPDQVQIDFDAAVDVEEAVIETSEATRYDQVVVRGARIGSVFTLSTETPDGSLVADWSKAQQDGYNAGASDLPGYGDWDPGTKTIYNADVRSSDAYERVYAWFRLAEDWDGKTDVIESGFETWAFVAEAAAESGGGEEADALPFWLPGLRFEPHLPLVEGQDYSGSFAWDPTWFSELAGRHFLRPIVAIREIDDDAPGPRWHDCDRLAGAYNAVETGDGGRAWSLHCACRDDAPGLSLRVAQPGLQHMIAAGDFAPGGAAPLDEDAWLPDPEFDWSGYVVATVYCLADQAIERRWPPDEMFLDPDAATWPRRTLVIDCPDAHFDYLRRGAVVGIAGGKLVRAENGGVLRDDRPRLEYLARTAAAWYCRQRRAIRLRFRQIRNLGHVGQLVTSIGYAESETEIATVITEVIFDFAVGATSIRTEAVELELPV